jgi:hypothetical protein
MRRREFITLFGRCYRGAAMRRCSNERERTGEFQSKGVRSWKSSPNWPRGFLIKSPTLSSAPTTAERSFAGTMPLPRCLAILPRRRTAKSVELIIPDHLRAAHWSGFDAAMAKGATKLQGRPTLTRALHKSGRRLYVEMSFAIVKGDTESEVLGAVAVARDVTERVERERAASRSS